MVTRQTNLKAIARLWKTVSSTSLLDVHLCAKVRMRNPNQSYGINPEILYSDIRKQTDLVADETKSLATGCVAVPTLKKHPIRQKTASCLIGDSALAL